MAWLAKQQRRIEMPGTYDKDDMRIEMEEEIATLNDDLAAEIAAHKACAKKVAKLQDWYDAIMAALEADGYIRYFRCGTCGGPVAANMCCAWCGTNDPVTANTDSAAPAKAGGSSHAR